MITQIQLVEAITNALNKYGPKDITVRQLSAVIDAANTVIEALSKDDVPAVPNMGLSRWRASDDTGLSSRYMASVIWGGKDTYAHPWDAADFGRCYRLIRAVPGTKDGLRMLRDKSKHWEKLVDSWDELERLYEEQCTQEKHKPIRHVLYERMRQLYEEICT